MARIAQGPGTTAVPVLTAGLSDQVWVSPGEASEVDGCYFNVSGSVEKARGVRNLVDWDWRTPHLLNTRINAIASFTVPGGPTELVISVSGDSGLAEAHYPDLAGMTGTPTKGKYKGGRVLVVRGDSLENDALPHIGEGSAWENRYDGGPEGDRFIAARRVAPTDQFGGDYFATWGGHLFISNGVDANLKWNGDYTSRVGVHEVPSAPTPYGVTPAPDEDFALLPEFSINDEFVNVGEGDRGNSLSSVQTFQYRATFVSASGAEGPPSPPGKTVTTGEVYKTACLNDIRHGLVGPHCWIEEAEPPNDGSGGTPITRNPHRALIKLSIRDRPRESDIVWRNIYKRAKDGEYYFWRQVCVNERVVYDFEDTLDSAQLGSPLKTRLSPPPTSKFIAFFRGRGYYVSESNPSKVFYSDQDRPEEMSSPLQFLDLNNNSGSKITGLVSFEDSLVVFKEDSVWQVTALSDGSPVLTPINEAVGSISPRGSIVAYGRLVFVGTDGVYQYDGASIKPLSPTLSRWWGRSYGEGLRTAVSWLDEKERRLFVAIQAGPDDTNDTVICYHYQLDAVTVVRGQRITAAARYKGESVLGVQFDEKRLKADVVRPARPLDKVVKKGKEKRSIRNSDLVIWGLGDSFTYDYSPGQTPGPRVDDLSVVAGASAGRIRFGPYDSGQTGWNAGEEMEVKGLDVFFPYSGDHEVTVRWYKNRNPVAEGSLTFKLSEAGTAANKGGNRDLEAKSGWGEKDWGSAWSGDQQLFQRLVFPDSVVCREIEIEFINSSEGEPFKLDGFVLWRTSKGSERQR